MEISIAAALKREGEQFPFEGVVDFGEATYLGRKLEFTGPVTASGTVLCDAGIITMEGSLKAEVAEICSRCAEPITESFDIPFCERFERSSVWDESHDTYTYDGDILRPDEALADNLFLNLPMAPVCREDCKGLCPVCGANRNYVDCGCVQEAPENHFSVLKQIPNQHKEV